METIGILIVLILAWLIFKGMAGSYEVSEINAE